MATKATKQEILIRDKRIQTLISEGLSRDAIISVISTEFKIAEGTARRSYYMVIEQLQKLANEERNELRAILMSRQEDIYKKAMNDESYKVALDAVNSQAKLGGLFETEVSADKKPDAIIFKEKDFSQTLAVVPKKVENNE